MSERCANTPDEGPLDLGSSGSETEIAAVRTATVANNTTKQLMIVSSRNFGRNPAWALACRLFAADLPAPALFEFAPVVICATIRC